MCEKIKCIAVFFFCLLCQVSVGAQYVFRHLDIIDGMSDNQIRSITMTPDGRLAVRTASILNLYNGATFEHFYQDRRKEYLWSYMRPPREYYDNEGRIWMKEAGYLLLLDLNTNRFEYHIEEELESLGVHCKLKNLFIDESKNYWFVTEGNHFLFYDIEKKELERVTDGESDFSNQYGYPLEMVQYKNLYWIVYSSGLIRCWDISSREFVSQDTRFLNVISEATDRLYIHPTSTGDIWLMFNFSTQFYNRTEKTWTEVATIGGPSNFFTCMDLDSGGNVWVGTSRSGLRLIHGETFKVETLPALQLDKGGVSDNDIYSIFVDQNDGVWVGTLFQGLFYYHPSVRKFQLVQTVESETHITNEIVRCFLEEPDGSVLVGTANGLFRYDPDTGKTEKVFNQQIKGLCLTLYRDSKNRIWVGTYMDGFYCIDGSTIRNYNRSLYQLDIYPNQNISRAIYEDPDGRYWVSVKNEGIGELDLQTGEITLFSKRFPQIKPYKICYYFYPIDRHTFAVVGEKGIFYYNTNKDSLWIPELDDPDSPKFRERSTKYYCMLKDSRSLEWFGTELGIRIWDDKTNKLYSIDVNDGLPNNTVSAILEDDTGLMWVSSANGVTRIDVNETENGYGFSLLNYTTSAGLQSGKFYDRSALKASNGLLYFGGIHGFNVFNPPQIVYNQNKSTSLFTSLKLFNSHIKENEPYNGRIIIRRPINKVKEVLLNHKENFITLEFSGLNYVNPSQTYFRYKLENVDQDWTEMVSNNGLGAATYTELRPGKYRLVVYAANSDKVWGEQPAVISIVIAPPVWATVYAYIFYAVLFAGAVFLLYLYMKERNRKKTSERKLIEERRQKEELDQMKFRFFTNISHEFRTPLTLIMTPLSTLIRQQTDSVLRQRLSSIYRNAEDMLSLINQLLDFRKLEMGGEKLKLSFDDIIQFTQYAFVSFKELAGNKSIGFTFESEVDYLSVWFDKSKVRKIINNLYSNALKFTKEGGQVSTLVTLVRENGRQFVKIEVRDTGCGISEKDQEVIFNRYYQGRDGGSETLGSGIGLHLAKEYAGLHQGKITVASKLDKGSTFSVYIPTDLSAEEENLPRETYHEEDHPINEEKKTILIVEDNVEFRCFLAEQLRPEFNVLTASDGEQGEEIVLSMFPDLIITDLMMPKLNGLVLCQRLKSNIQTSHIPIILLTAYLSDEAKIDSYKAGADSYISKPFSFEVLQARIQMLIEQLEKRKELFHQTIEISPSSITITSLDEELVEKSLQLVETNISNPDYSVDDLSLGIGLSRSQMYRKLQSITGLTPNEFIRSVKLKRSAQLLKEDQYNISEIAELVGFNTIKYFNRYFKDEFGMTPSQYRTENINKEHL